MEARWLKRLLQAHGVGVCSHGAELGTQPAALSLSPRTNHNNVWDLILARSIPRGTTERCWSAVAAGYFLLNLLVLFFQCLMLSSTTILLTKCQHFSAKGNISLIVCYFAADCAGNRLYSKASASYLLPVAEWTSHFQSRVFANPWAHLAYGRGFQYQNKSGLLFLDV